MRRGLAAGRHSLADSVVTVEQDHAADRNFAIVVGGLMATEVLLAALADAGALALWIWCILAVVAVFIAAGLARIGQKRVP
jgi:hypothetical protein